MRAFFSRLGIVGVSLIAAALIFGALSGGIVVHRLTSSPAASSQKSEQGNHEQEQGDQGGQGDQNDAGDTSPGD